MKQSKNYEELKPYIPENNYEENYALLTHYLMMPADEDKAEKRNELINKYEFEDKKLSEAEDFFVTKNVRFKCQENICDLLASYICSKYSKTEQISILNEINNLSDFKISFDKKNDNSISYKNLQFQLSKINERNQQRKNKGVYYTETDITDFIINNCFSLYQNKAVLLNNKIKINSNCLELTVFDPTCGTGEFLLSALNLKTRFIYKENKTKTTVSTLIHSIKGNDIDITSISISKIRVFLYILENFGIDFISNVSQEINKSFTCKDFLKDFTSEEKFDFVVGNPPYIENSLKSKKSKYGNIYADVILKVSQFTNNNSVFGFIIPLSYISTLRMSNVRSELLESFKEQIILSYADRPSSLFSTVHQKLCIVLAKKNNQLNLYTSNYQYWYKSERKDLFKRKEIINNKNINTKFIPKLGNDIDKSIYLKIRNKEKKLIDLFSDGKFSVYLNERATFWIKAFLTEHTTSEYKKITCKSFEDSCYLFCLLNSSLFWWYWIVVSDCWHITNKEKSTFGICEKYDAEKITFLAKKLEKKLQSTKLYIGTKQTEYEYKHKNCLQEIYSIDDYISTLYGLTETENKYIKNFAISYRIGDGRK